MSTDVFLICSDEGGIQVSIDFAINFCQGDSMLQKLKSDKGVYVMSNIFRG